MGTDFQFIDGASLLSLCEEHKMTISQIMFEREKMFGDETENIAKMKRSYEIMREAVKEPILHPRKSIGGLIGGEAEKINKLRLNQKNICGTVVSKAVAYAMGVLEVNASMGLIVAAPTAGSSGVIPGVFVALQEEFGFDDETMEKALFHTGAIAYLIHRNATVSGAVGGCQAEVGAASAMAASAVTELMGGTPKQCLDAAANAISNLMGLVCDPIAGLVEDPCQKRNGIGASNALICAEIALSGVESFVPFDEMVDAMYQVGKRIPYELRETALGGLAATKTACSRCVRHQLGEVNSVDTI